MKVLQDLKANKLSINIDKTKRTIFHPIHKKRFMSTKFPELFIDGLALEREVFNKFLGVSIYKRVTWKDPINTSSTKISKSIDILYRARLIIPRKQLNHLYFAFVHSYLNYANLAWALLRKLNFLLFIVSNSTELDY